MSCHITTFFSTKQHESETQFKVRQTIPANIRLDEDVLKTSFVFVFRRRLQDVLIKTNIFALALRLQKTSSRRLGQDQYICFGHMSSRRLQDVFKTFLKRLQNVFKASSRRLQDVFKVSSRRLQDVFKTSCKDIFKRKFMVSVENLLVC